MSDHAYRTCERLNSRCSCRERQAGPCDSILDVVANGGVLAERKRVAENMSDLEGSAG